MTQVHFHCSNGQRVLVSSCDTEVADLDEAREQAAMVVQSLIATPGAEDWRGWVLHVRDDLGDEVFALPFKALIRYLH